MRNVLLSGLLSCGLAGSVLAQSLTVSLPIEGAVYQQNAQHQGKIYILGFFNSQRWKLGYYNVSAKLESLDIRTGNPTGEAPQQHHPKIRR